MEIDLKHLKRKRAVSGILAAVILFAMLFTVGTGFFLFANTQNNFYDQALSARNTAQKNQLSESLALNTIPLTDGNIGLRQQHRRNRG
jgi:flagellin-like protein